MEAYNININLNADDYVTVIVPTQQDLGFWPIIENTPLIIESVDEFSTALRKGRETLILNHSLRNGIFKYFPSNAGLIIDNGIVFQSEDGGFWVRQFSGKVELIWFGVISGNDNNNKDTNFEAIKQWWNAGIRYGKALYVNTGTYITKMFGDDVSGFNNLGTCWIVGEQEKSEFKLAAGENTRLFSNQGQFSAGIKGIRFNGNNPPLSWGAGDQLNPNTPELVYLTGYGNTYDNITATFSGGKGFVFGSQMLDFRRIKAYYNVGWGIETIQVYNADFYSPWIEANGDGGLLIRGAADGTNSRLIAYSHPSIRIYGAYGEKSVPSIELRGVCNVEVFGGTQPATPGISNPTTVKITSDPTSVSGRQYSHSNVIHWTGINHGLEIEAGCIGNTVFLTTGEHFVQNSPEFRNRFIDNDGRNIIKRITKVGQQLPVGYNANAINYLTATNNPANALNITNSSTATKVKGSIFNPALAHVSGQNMDCHLEVDVDETTNTRVDVYGSYNTIPASSKLYVQYIFNIPAYIFTEFQIRDRANNVYYDFISKTWTNSGWKNYILAPSGELEYCEVEIENDSATNRKIEVQIQLRNGLGVNKKAKLYYVGLSDTKNAGITHHKNNYVIGYGFEQAFFTSSLRPPADEIPTGTRIFNTTTNKDNISDGTNWRDSAGNLA
ncbi:hypothetical protein SAMN04488057_1055 [Cyclobacterium lianum]|uniref:Uncharacterized protein n=1 Tax=Cyclobacterium lianum TaxID=388280 RepID=A0A1M7N1J5_9BACT|nr:hypothetical protein [Cyclobacterium lianum]SHM97432.1 hypothetical protein SAMN04488057_1055 [Cyclobacterium lianum]